MSTFNAVQQAHDSRLAAACEWLAGVLGGPPEELAPASEDASFRRYFRLAFRGASLVLMDAPPQLEPVAPFLQVGEWLTRCGLHVPAVHAADPARGFVLLEDMGDLSYLAALQADPEQAERLYAEAILALVALQVEGRAFQQQLPAYDAALLDREMALFRDWLCLTHLALELTAAEQRLLDDTFILLRDAALAQPQVFVHRDFHSRNLMVCGERNPGVLDFQDAVAGPITYDLVSLLKDCYIDWPVARREQWVRDYRRAAAERGLPVAGAEAFARQLALMGVQRHLKAAGIFARLWHRDGKRRYLDDIPRTLAYVTEASREVHCLLGLGEFIEARVLPGLAARAP